MDRQTLIAFIDELEKISSAGGISLEKISSYDPELLELMKEAGLFSTMGRGIAKGLSGLKHSGPMKAVRRMTRGAPQMGSPLSPRAKAKMQRMTGFGQAPQQTAFAPRQQAWRRELGGQGMTTEMTGMRGAASDQAAKRMARQQFDASLQRQGAVYRSASPGTLEQRISQIPGHPQEITRTPARVAQPGTVAATPRAMASRASQTAPGTVAAGPAARRASQVQQRMGTAQTAVQPRQAGMGYEPTMLAPLPA